MQATLSRGSTSVEIPVLSNQAGAPLLVRTFGKPNLNIQETGALNPRHVDQWSGLLQYNILGRFHDSNAYSDAITLTDLVKSNSNGTPLTLDIPLDDFDDDVTVAPAASQDEALSLAYEPGGRNQVDVDLGLTRINQTVGGSDQPATTPTASGTGPVQLGDGDTTVDLTADVVVERAVGRPQSVIRRAPATYPNHTEKHKTAYDSLELSFEFVENAVSMANDISSLLQTQLGRESLTLSFNGLYGLGDFDVVPDGSDAMRLNRVSGEQGTTLVPSLTLRRVR